MRKEASGSLGSEPARREIFCWGACLRESAIWLRMRCWVGWVIIQWQRGKEKSGPV